MTALIWMLTWLPQVLPAMSELPSPVKLTFDSNNFIHLLKWEPGPGTPRGVSYSVHTVRTDTETTWHPVTRCQNVTQPLVCDLTEAFSDRFETYGAAVAAQLEGQTSNLENYIYFQPIRDTHLDLPLLSVTPCDGYLCVDLQSPVEHLREFYDERKYNLRLEFNGVEKKKDIHSLKRVTFSEYVLPGKKYCVSVCFSDTVQKSNYSRPVCYLSPSLLQKDALIGTLLCLLAVVGVVIVALLFSAGFICLRRRPLPLVLASIHHLDEVLVVSPRSSSLSSLLNLKPTPPSSGENGSKQTLSEDSDEESETESSGGGGYKLRVGTNLLSSSSSSSSCLAALLSPAPEPTPGFSSNQTSDSPTHTASHSEPQPEVSEPPADSVTGGGIQTIKEEEEREEREEEEVKEEAEEEEEGCQGVNLLTLTFGSHDDDKEEEEESHDEISAILPTQTQTQTQDAEEEAALKSNEEEEEEEEDEEDDCGYMRRPPPRVLQNLK